MGLIFLFLEYLLDKIQNNENSNNLQTQIIDEEEIVELIMDNFQGIQDQTEKLIDKRKINDDSIGNFYDKLILLRQDFISIKDVIYINFRFYWKKQITNY